MTIGDTPIAIVGMAGVFPGAPDVDTFWSNIVGGVDATSDAPAERIDPVFFDDGATSPDRFYCRRGGFVDTITFDPAAHGIMPLAAAEAEPDQLVVLNVADHALADAGYADGVPDPSRAGIVIGRGGYINAAVHRLDQRVRTAQQLVETLRELLPGVDDELLGEVRVQFQHALGPAHSGESIGLVPNLTASRVANRLDLQGPAYTIDAACASSLIAVSDAARGLVSGECDVMLAGAVHHSHDITLWSMFCQLGALSRKGVIRPFDRRADGILIGEGTGIVVLKRLGDAERDGDRIYAVLRGIGVASDGRAATLMSPAVEGQVLALRRAWSDAGLDPTTVNLVEAHGTGTPAGDAAEIETLDSVFGRGTGADPAKTVGLGSVKSMIGHAMPASGIASILKVALAVHHGVLPPTLHCEEPHPDLEGTRFRLVDEPDDWHANGTARRAGVDAFGFGGINAHAVMESHASAHGAGPHRRRGHRRNAATARNVSNGSAASTAMARTTDTVSTGDATDTDAPVLFVAAADDLAGLSAQLADDETVLAGTAWHAAPGPDSGPFRIAIADPTPKRIALARKVIARGKPWRGRNEIWFSDHGLVAGGGKVAFAYPGIEPAAGVDVGDLVEHFGIDLPRFDNVAGVGLFGAEVLWRGRVLSEALGRLDVAPDVVVGHSLGEWNAMIASQSLPAEAVDDFLAGLVSDELRFPDLVFLAVGCSAATAEAAIQGLDEIAVSHDNCPHQAIICGREDQVTIAQERLGANRVMGQVLPYRTGLHTPMFQPYVARFIEHFEPIPLKPPVVPMWSSITTQPFPDDDPGIRELGTRLYVEQVRFRELVANLYADHVRVFVQPGVGSVASFVDDTLHDSEHLAIAATVEGRSGLGQLARVAGALFVEGVAVRFDALARPELQPARVAPHAQGMLVRLGASLVRGGLTPLRVGAPRGTAPPGPLAGEVTATLDAVEAASREIADALAAATPATPTSAEASEPPPPTHVRRSVTISVDTEPALVDHAIIPQRPGHAVLADRYPVVPLAMMLDLFVDAARRLAPNKIAIGLENIRAMRWLEVEPPADVTIDATVEGVDRVKVSIEGYARGTVVFDDAYPEPPAADSRPLAKARSAPVDAAEMYRGRWMFHGPAYQGVEEIIEVGDDGMRGRLRALPAPGALYDAGAQLLGHWVHCTCTRDRISLPSWISRVELFGPRPPDGENVDCTVRVHELTAKNCRGTVELTHRGCVWARLVDWTDRRFESTSELFEVFRQPEHLVLAEQRDGYWMLREHWGSAATRELVMHLYLGPAERGEYQSLTPKAQGEWLLGRIAVKDAVREWLRARGHGPVFPVEVEVRNAESGRPIVTCPGPLTPQISLSHAGGLAVVAISDAEPPGIDIEPIVARNEPFHAMTMTAREQSLGAESGFTSDEWATAAWTAKEAVAKALGTGLQGRPKDIEISAIDREWLAVAGHWVRTSREEDCIVSTVTPR